MDPINKSEAMGTSNFVFINFRLYNKMIIAFKLQIYR